MKAYKEKCLNNHKGRGPLYYKRYLDDIFCIFERHEDAFKFLDHITLGHRNIRFKVKEEINRSLPVLSQFSFS